MIPLPPPLTRRERDSERAVEGIVVAAIGLSAILALAHRAATPPATGPPLRSLVIDVARDPPWRLRLLPSIGPMRAAAIVRDREVHGPPRTVDDLRRIRGLGEKFVRALEAAGAVAGEEIRSIPDDSDPPNDP